MTRDCTYGLGGNGLLVSGWSNICVIRNADGGVTFLRKEAETTPIGWLLAGDRPASAAPTEITRGMWRFGVGGPTLELDEGVTLDDVSARFDTGLADSPWSVIGPDFVTNLPAGVLLWPGTRPRADFELHLPRTTDHFVSFLRFAGPTSRMPMKPGPGQEVVVDEQIENGDRIVRSIELTYAHEGEPWRQRFWITPVAEDKAIHVRAQAIASRASELFAAAEEVAFTIALL